MEKHPVNTTINQETHLSCGVINHASSILCLENNRQLIAFYSGRAECDVSQRVVIFLNDNGKIKGPVELDSLTGNPVLFKGPKSPQIIYTKFEEFPSNRVKWWQHCRLYQQSVNLNNGLISLGKRRKIIVDEPSEPAPPPKAIGYVTRCHPIAHDGKWLLPIYREHEPYYHGVILESQNGVDWNYHSRIGADEPYIGIQPTIWKEDGKLKSLSRSFAMVAKKDRNPAFALYSEFDGKNWAPLEPHLHYNNYNNSLVAYALPNLTLVAWNDDPRGRSNLTLGINGKPIIVLDHHYGSYPAISADNKNLHVTYTSKHSPIRHPGIRTVIKHKYYNLEALDRYCRPQR